MTIATKKMLKTIFWMFLVAINIVGFMAVSNVSKNGVYTVDTEEFTSVIEWGEDISINDIKIIDNRVFGLAETTLTEDMIVSIEDTNTAGQKKIVFEHNNKQFTIVFDVKYKIEFVAYGKVVDTQMVVNPDELNLPTPDAKTGYEFSHWDYDFSQGFTQSVKIEAVFKETKYPALTMLNATYGDTLADLTLPSDDRGHWEFLDSLDTPVGNAGKNYFNVRFVFNGDDSYYKYSEIEVKVNKKELQFTVDDSQNVFTYDGLAHSPSYSLDIEVDNVVIHGGDKTDAGTYGYRLEIVDDRYFGTYHGSFEITKPTVIVNISSEEVEFATNLVLPEFTYTVEGFERIDLLKIEIALPERTAVVGEYEVGINLEKANQNVNYIINKGTLTILQAETDPDDVPEFRYEIPTYGDKLEDLVIAGFYTGDWEIETKDEYGNDIIFDSMDGLTAYATYTPHNTNYKPIRVQISITQVNKRELTITVLQNEFDYEAGKSYQIIYRIEGGDFSHLTVINNDAESQSGDYARIIEIYDEYYCGQVETTLIIHKSIPKTEFDKPINVTWKEGLTLSDVILPDGYVWKITPSISGVGVYTFEAIYNHPTDDNYIPDQVGTFTVYVNQAAPTFANLLDEYIKNYDAEKFDIKNSGILAYHMTIKPVIKYYVGDISLDDIANAEEIAEIINAGTYTVVISIAEEGNYHAITIKRVVTVNVADNEQEVDTEQSGKYLDNTSEKLALPENVEGTWSWSITTLNQMGEMTLTAIFTPDSTGNYNPRTVTVTVIVDKKPIDVPTIKSKEFTGNWIDIEYTDNEIYIVSGDLSAQALGTYYVTFTLVEPDKYEWVGFEDETSVEKSYKVTEAPNNWIVEPADKITASYNPNGGYVYAEAEHGTPTYIYKTLDGTVVEGHINVGKYKVTIIIDPDNYETLEKTIDLEVTQVTVPVPSGNDLVYNGSAQGVTVTNDNLGKLYDIVEGSDIKATNAGDASSVVVSLIDSVNYKWDKAAGADYTVSVKIAKATLSFAEGSVTTIDKDDWIYTETECGFGMADLSDVAIGFGAEAILKYSTNNIDFFTLEEFIEDNKTNGLFNAGTYYVKTVIPADTNWNESSTDSVSFTVYKATPTSITATFSGGIKDGDLYYQNLLEFKDIVVYFGDIEVSVEEITSANYVLIGGFQGAESVIGFIVKPTDSKNFDEVELSVGVIPLKAVASIYKNGSKVADYGSIEDALKNAKSGDTVWVNMDSTGNVYIKSDVVVKTGVTLILPYGEYGDGVNKNDEATLGLNATTKEYTHIANTLPEQYRMTLVKLASGVILKVEGNLTIAGELTGGAAGYTSGHTAGRYATIELEGNASIEVTGTVKCYGFIENAPENEDGKITIFSGGNIYAPFVLYDFKGGTIMSGIKYALDKYQVAPFHQFAFPNICTTLGMYYGSTFTVICNLWAGDQNNNANAPIIGATSEAFIQLTDSSNSYLEAKYDPATHITDLKIYGGAKLNSFKLKISLSYSGATIPVEVESKNFVFAISWLYNITLDNALGQDEAVFEMPHSYKLMPGSKLTVEEGVKLVAGTLTVYDDSFVDRMHDGYVAGVYPTVYPEDSSLAGQKLASAELVVNGTIEATNLAGTVYTVGDNPVIKVSGKSILSTYEPTIVVKSSIGVGQVDEVQTVTRYLRLVRAEYIKDEETDELILNEIFAIGGIDGIKEYRWDADKLVWIYNSVAYETVEVTLKDGYGVYTDYAVITDENGNDKIVTYDSRESKQNSTIRVVKGYPFTLYLNKNEIAVFNNSSTVTVDMYHPMILATETYQQTVIATSNLTTKIYQAPTFTFGTVTINATITYSGFNSDSGVIATIVKKVENTIYQNGVLSLNVQGVAPGDITFTQTGSPAGVDSQTGRYTITGTDAKNGHKVSITVTITITSDIASPIILSSGFSEGTKDSCIAPDTLITLADGSQVRVDSLTGNELLLVWNLETGRFDFAPIMFIDSELEAEFKVVYLYFSDGTVVKVIYEHGFWDYDLNKYVYLDENAALYIGHTFAKQNGDSLEKVQLVNVEIKTERITAWSPVTVGHLCYFVNGMLSMPGGVGGLFNIFDVDPETMTYDYEAIERDIAEYGLFTYEELNAICPLSEEMFNAAGGAYLKISIGKGNLTIEELIAMIERYSQYI